MKIVILTYGSRGDIQPFLPLSLGLMSRGHSLKLAAPSRFKDLVEGVGIPFVPLAGEPQELSLRMNEAGNNFVRLLRAMRDYVSNIAVEVMLQTNQACQDADLIIHSFLHAVGGHTLARGKKIPDIHIQTFPMFTPTGDYPNVTFPDLRYASLNRLTHALSGQITWWGARLGFEQVRRRAGLPRQKLYWPFEDNPIRPRTPILCAWSPSLLPPSRDWPPRVHVTGWYFSSSSGLYRPPLDLQRFLDAGEPAVCVSFGSMVHRNREEIDRIVRDSLSQTGNRGIILTGWGQVAARSSSTVLYLDSVPHDWLLPQCKLIIHHGGAGTTSAGLQAGIPNIVVPFTADQPFWARRIHAVGAGPASIPVKRLSVGKLSQAILEAGTGSCREHARVIGQKIRSETGVDLAVEWIEKYSNEFHSLPI